MLEGSFQLLIQVLLENQVVIKIRILFGSPYRHADRAMALGDQISKEYYTTLFRRFE